MEKASDAQYGAPLHAQGAGKPKQTRPSQAAIGDFDPKPAELSTILRSIGQNH